MYEEADQIIFHAQDRKQALLKAITSAQGSIKMSMFRCTDNELLDELGNACARGVVVKVLLSKRVKGWKEKLENLESGLRDKGIQVERYEGALGKYHAKYLIVDNHLALITSYNFTRKCYLRTHDFGFVTRNLGLVRALTNLFSLDWHQLQLEGEIDERLIISPINSRAKLRQLISSARQRIQIVDHKIKDPEFVELLKTKSAQGIAIRVLGNPSGELSSNGIQVRDFSTGVPHGKLMIIDDRLALIGSIALSSVSLDRRREVTVSVDNRNCIAHLSNFFKSHFDSQFPSSDSEEMSPTFGT